MFFVGFILHFYIFESLTPKILYIMKKLMFILALIAMAASCTPESLSSDDQQIDKNKYEIPPNG